MSTTHPLFFTADFAGPAGLGIPSDEDYTAALYDAQVYLLPSHQHRYGDEQLLASLRGLRLDVTSSDLYPTWRLTVDHAYAFDFEHSAVHLLDMTILSPTLPCGLRPHGTEVVGVLASIYAYADASTAFVTAPSDDGDLHADARWCEGCEAAHPEGRYRAPARPEMAAITGQVVRLVLTPLSPAPPASGRA